MTTENENAKAAFPDEAIIYINVQVNYRTAQTAWAAIVSVKGDHWCEFSGSAEYGLPEQAELQAATAALYATRRCKKVILVTDSGVLKGLDERTLRQGRRHGNSETAELWADLALVMRDRDVSWTPFIYTPGEMGSMHDAAELARTRCRLA